MSEPLHCCGTTTDEHRDDCPGQQALAGLLKTPPTPAAMLGDALERLREADRLSRAAGWPLGLERAIGDAEDTLASLRRDAAVRIAEPRWLEVARGEVGQKEVSGKAHNPRVLEYHATTSLKATTDEVPWCSSFVNWCMQRAGVKGTGSAAAASWEKWGLPAPSRPGAVVVLYSAKAAGSMTVTGNHVGFLLEETPTHYRVLGGNQSDAVKVSEFSMAAWALKACRWPAGGGK